MNKKFNNPKIKNKEVNLQNTRDDKKNLNNQDKSNNDSPNGKNLELVLQKQIEDLKEEKLRLLAEMDNLRKRTEKDKIDSIKYGSANLARDMLSPGDNLSRALDSISSDLNNPKSLKNLIEGLKLVEKEFMTILEKHGVKKIEALQKKFDHNFHQAILKVETDEFEEGMVVQEAQSGFIMHDRLLRPSMVGVSTKPEKERKNLKKD